MRTSWFGRLSSFFVSGPFRLVAFVLSGLVAAFFVCFDGILWFGRLCCVLFLVWWTFSFYELCCLWFLGLFGSYALCFFWSGGFLDSNSGLMAFCVR